MLASEDVEMQCDSYVPFSYPDAKRNFGSALPSKHSISYLFAGISIANSGAWSFGRFGSSSVSPSSSMPKSKHSSWNSSAVNLDVVLCQLIENAERLVAQEVGTQQWARSLRPSSTWRGAGGGLMAG
jgi:hypothetical protein